HPSFAELKEALAQMGFIDRIEPKGNETILFDGCWEVIKKDNKVYLISKDAYNELPSHAKGPFVVKEQKTPVVKRETKKTVILHGGIYSYKDSGKMAAEVSRFMNLGFNVVISDYKNQRLDSESHTNVMLANECIHNALKEQGIENKDIIRKGTCF